MVYNSRIPCLRNGILKKNEGPVNSLKQTLLLCTTNTLHAYECGHLMIACEIYRWMDGTVTVHSMVSEKSVTVMLSFSIVYHI